MTYIKWKDEVESYLGNLSESEKQKVFSYFAEMYADKRDAGMSEESIIEGFGAPYDVAQRILNDSRENSPSAPGESVSYSADSGNVTIAAAQNPPQSSGSTFGYTLLIIVTALGLGYLGAVATLLMFYVTTGSFITAIIFIIEGIQGLAAGLGRSEVGLLGAGIILIGISTMLVPVCTIAIKNIWKGIVKLIKNIKARKNA